MKKLLLSLFLTLSSALTFAQVIQISSPADAGKQYSFILNKGTKTDTIQSGTLTFAGTITIRIPNEHKGFKGMGSLRIANGKNIPMIVSSENFSITINEAGEISFANSVENTAFNKFIQQRVEPLSTLYANYFVKTIQLYSQINNIMNSNQLTEANAIAIREQISKLDFDKLYTSGLWYNVVDMAVKISSDTQENTAKYMINILKGVKSQEVFVHLCENLILITQQFGMDDAFELIVTYIRDSKRIPYPQGDVYDAIESIKVKNGQVAPTVVGLERPNNQSYNRTLLVFYQPSCDVCESQLKTLIQIYTALRIKGVRVVTISSDDNKAEFAKDKARFPWEDSLCDYKGFAGPNFMNYGIMGTPSYFLLDKNFVLIKKYASLADIPL